MAIQPQMYPDASVLGPVEWGGGAVGMRDEMCMDLQRQQQRMLQFQNWILQLQQQEQHQAAADTSSFGTFTHGLSLGSVVAKQSFEIDHYIRSQSKRLRLVLREQWKRQVTELLKEIEARTSALLKQKDEEIARAANRTSHLESLILKLQNEAQTWQNIARQNELHVVSLRNSIELFQQAAAARGGVYGGDAVVEDSESCCDESNGDGAQTVCRMCQTRERNVVLLPCRHMCCCTVCVNMIEFCPVCQTAKKATIEVLFH